MSPSPQIFPLNEGEKSSDSTTLDKNTAGTHPSLPWYLKEVQNEMSFELLSKLVGAGESTW